MTLVHSADCIGSIPGQREAAAKAILAAELKDEKRLHPSNTRRALRARANKARRFPTNTCPASRHVHIMADELSTVGFYQMFEDEPLHSAGSLYAVIAALWEARSRIAELEARTPAADTQVGIPASCRDEPKNIPANGDSQ